MATDSKNLVEEIIDNALDPSTHLVDDEENGGLPETVTTPPGKRKPNDPLNSNLVPDPDKP